LIEIEFNKEKLIKSPLNYTGNKFNLLEQILPFFPNYINTFYDVFGGSGTVGVNINCNKIVYNEYNKFIYELVQYISECNAENELQEIHNIINKYGLNKGSKKEYYYFRDEIYNKNQTPQYLFILTCFSLNSTLRFNQKELFNQSCGNRGFSKDMEQRFIQFNDTAKHKIIEFQNMDFSAFDSFDKDDFVYLDPPYNLTTTTYNETSRLGGGWTVKNEQELYNFIDRLNKDNIKFALSNVSIYRNKENTMLINWSKKYKLHNLNYTYKNNNFNGKDNSAITEEVLITNY
jgi:DNA adenine methylase Dam